MNTTDYTQEDSTLIAPITPSRFGSYMLDLCKQWFADHHNLIYPQLYGLQYREGDTPAALTASNIYLDIEWPSSPKLSGKTPAVIISFGESSITPMGIGQRVFVGGPTFPGEQRTYQWNYSITVNIRTEAYAGSQYITEQLMLYLSTYRHQIQVDANLSDFQVVGLTAPQHQENPGDSKDIFNSAIVCKVQSAFTATVDTTGPVFRGIEYKPQG